MEIQIEYIQKYKIQKKPRNTHYRKTEITITETDLQIYKSQYNIRTKKIPKHKFAETRIQITEVQQIQVTGLQKYKFNYFELRVNI